jgi:Leucine-rich repeat (LRR) protein
MYIARRVVAILFIILFVFSCKKTATSSEPVVVTFPDANFETLIREVLNIPSGEIIDVDLLTITDFNGENKNITDISGIEYFTNLQKLYLGYNQINDISALSTLTNIQELCLEVNQIVEIGALSLHTNLQKLYLGYNQVKDISALSALTNLQELYLYMNQIIDIYPLIQNSGIDNGDIVDLSHNPLNETTINTYIPQLESRGVNVIG